MNPKEKKTPNVKKTYWKNNFKKKKKTYRNIFF